MRVGGGIGLALGSVLGLELGLGVSLKREGPAKSFLITCVAICNTLARVHYFCCTGCFPLVVAFMVDAEN